MAQALFRRGERIALGIALAVHGGVLALLLLRPAPPLPPPEVRMNVTLAEDAAPTATALKPAAQAQADIAPTLGTAAPVPRPAPPAPVPKPRPKPVPVPPPPKPVHHQPRPAPVPPPPPPKPVPVHHKAPPAPAPRVVPSPTPPPPARHARAAPDDDPIAAAIASSHAPPRHHPAARPAEDASDDAPAPARPHHGPTGGNRIGADFLKGLTADNTASRATGAPAKADGPTRAALAGAISRQLKPHWIAPQGVDADQLVTILAFDLNPDGTLAGEPRVVAQRGIDDSNRPQARIHAENAIRAVRLSAPFALPPEYYDAWKHVTAFQFDRKLSQ